MAVELNHLIVFARDKQESATFLSDILGLPPPQPAGFFLAVELSNHVTLDYAEPGCEFTPQHYAFLISEEEFDASFARIQERGLAFSADPHGRHPARSTPTTAAAASTSSTQAATGWSCSPALTAVGRSAARPDDNAGS